MSCETALNKKGGVRLTKGGVTASKKGGTNNSSLYIYHFILDTGIVFLIKVHPSLK